MPTQFVAQNGATLDQSTHIEVEGCSNTLGVVSKKVKGKTITLKVYVPSRGKLTASGKGLSKASKSSSFNEALTLTLHAKKSGKFSTKIKLSFVPEKGKHQSKILKVKFSK
jgi:phage tail sheath gpL-like